MTYEQRLAELMQLVEQGLERLLPESKQDWQERAIPLTLNKAMRYSLLAPGKRLRPMLLLAAHALLDASLHSAVPFAVAMEMIHAYSLVHDDLPAMDDDDLRRGRPTNHIVFGEAIAILTGDALLNQAYQVMAESGHLRGMQALALIATHAGSQGMIAGQAADIAMEGKDLSASMLQYIHLHKTADLFIGAMKAGLALAGADAQQLSAGEAYGKHLGLAFQIVDDLQDVLGNQADMGKRLHKDAEKGKLTWPAVYGVDQARQDAASHIESAMAALNCFGHEAAFLQELARNTLSRIR